MNFRSLGATARTVSRIYGQQGLPAFGFAALRIRRESPGGILSIAGGKTFVRLVAAVAAAAVWFVPPDAYAASTFLVPQNFPTVQAAINAASNGDTVLVSPGTYVENIDFLGKEITVKSSAGAASTILDGNRAGPVVTMNLGSTSQAPVLMGFTIRNGLNFPSGGGVATFGGPVVIQNNVISNNIACDGGGIAAQFSSATIENNTISGNSENCTGGMGSGIFVGGAGTVQIRGNVISANSADSGGGGIALFAAGTPTISGNFIRNNSGGNTGGGIALLNQSDALITNNVISGNSAADGGGIYFLVPFGAQGPGVVNNTIANNSAASGSAVFADGFGQNPRLVNNIAVGAGTAAVVTCGTFSSVPPVITFNDVFNTNSGPVYGGICTNQTGLNGNISADPLFVNAASDFHLQPGSPAIDAGTNTGAPTTDIEGTPRPLDGNGDGIAVVDMGAYEFRLSDTTPPVITVPGPITTNATSPNGAVVTYSVSAADPDDAVASLSCVPASGSAFPIGTTMVTCKASDTHGNTSSATFTVHVKGAAEQLADLATAVAGIGPGTSLADKVSQAQTYLTANDVADACPTLGAFINEVKAQSSKTIAPGQAATLVATAQRIETVLSC